MLQEFPQHLLVRVLSSFSLDPASGCWNWTLTKQKRGYGHYPTARNYGWPTPAHRLVWFLLRYPLPPILTIDHLCRNKSCVNPAHLDPCPSRVNTLRGNTIPARNLAKTHCLRGHPFSPENTYLRRKYVKNRLQGLQRTCRRCALDHLSKKEKLKTAVRQNRRGGQAWDAVSMADWSAGTE